MINKFNQNSLRWLEIILSERFGHKWKLELVKEKLHLKLPGSDHIIIFDNLVNDFFKRKTDISFSKWNAKKEGWDTALPGLLPAPGISKLKYPLIEKYKKNYVFHYDIMGLIYWMLNRVEELGVKDLDNHNRFPAVSSHAYKNNYLDREKVWMKFHP